MYSDNAPELLSALKDLKWRHVLSKEYISKSNAIAERSIRSVLEGARVNLHQAGLHHMYWPHAARHWCMMQNVMSRTGSDTPWKIRFGENFKGPLIPFGCHIDYWNGPRKRRVKDGLKFEATSSEGIFMGYAIHPEFMWKEEFFVASLKQLIDNAFDEPAQIMRVIKINRVDDIVFPLSNRPAQFKGIASDDQDDDDGVDRDLSDQDAKPAREPEPTVKQIEDGEMPQSSSAGAVYNPTWLGFLRHVDNREGWYEYADAHINVKEFSENFIEPTSISSGRKSFLLEPLVISWMESGMCLNQT